jgi:hypothetical protein
MFIKIILYGVMMLLNQLAKNILILIYQIINIAKIAKIIAKLYATIRKPANVRVI